MKKYLISAISLALLLTFQSCNDGMSGKQEMPKIIERPQEVQYTGSFVNIALDVPLRENNVSSNTRSFAMTKDTEGKISIDYENMLDKEMNVYCALLKPGQGLRDITSFVIKAKVIKEDNMFKLKADGQTIQMNKGDLDDSYYIQAMTMGPGTDMQQYGNVYRYTMSSDVASLCDMENKQMNIPLGTKWTKLTDPTGKNITITNLKFDPLVTIIKLKGINPLAKDIRYKKLKIKTKSFTNKGTFTVGIPPKSDVSDWTTESVKFNPEYGGQEHTLDLPVLKDFLSNPESEDSFRAIPKGGNADCYIYVVSDNITSKLEAQSSMQISYEYEIVDNGVVVGGTQISDVITKTVSNDMIKSGERIKVNKVELPESDLMITEFFHFNPGGGGYNVIEIYNPTSKPIDMREYGLLRLRTFTASGGPGFHPHDTWKGAKNVLMQQIYVDPEKTTSGNFEVLSATRDVFEEGTNLGKRVLDYKYMYDTENNAKGSRQGYMLQPGQCIILCSDGIYNAYVNNNDRGRELHGADFAFNDFNQYLTNGKCKYILGVKTAAGNNNYQHDPSSSVLAHGAQHIMVLAKYVKEGTGWTMAVVDETGPALDYLDKYNEDIKNTTWRSAMESQYKKYKEVFGLENFKVSVQRDDYDLIRRPYVMYPSPHEWKYNFNMSDETKFNGWDKREWDMYTIKGYNEQSLIKEIDVKGKLHTWGIH